MKGHPYLVLSASPAPRGGQAPVASGGDLMRLGVQIPGLEVCLGDETNQHGGLTLHYRDPLEITRALERFVPGKTVYIDFLADPNRGVADEEGPIDPQASATPQAAPEGQPAAAG